MPMPSLRKLVRDWGGFERLVARLHDTGSVSVEHNVVLTGRSGAPRQCDVVIRHREGLYEHLVIVECKHWRKNVSRLHVDALATAVRDLKASKGVIMTAKGFQSGAKQAALSEGIELFRVRDLTDDEWGPDGPVIEIILQLINRSLGKIQFHKPRRLGPKGAPIDLNIRLGSDRTQSYTPMVNVEGTATGSLEQILTDKSLQALQDFVRPDFVINAGEECTRYMYGAVNLLPEQPFRLRIAEELILVDGISFDLAIKCVQSPLRLDRRDKFAFALAVEDCITDTDIAASRGRKAEHTKIEPLTAPAFTNQQDAVTNGTIMKVVCSSWFQFAEIQGLEPIRAPAPLRVGASASDEKT